MNVFTVTGRLTADPARRDTDKGVVVEFRLAVDGQRRLWLPVTCGVISPAPASATSPSAATSPSPGSCASTSTSPAARRAGGGTCAATR